MKKLLLILIVLGTMGCSTMGYYRPKYSIGMTEQEFVTQNKSSEKVYVDNNNIVIYRTQNGFQSSFAFFVFKKGSLTKYEEGNSADDYKFMQK